MIARAATSRLARLVAAVALCATLAPPMAALGIDLDAYRQQVSEARQMVDAAASKPLTDREATDLALEVNALVPLRIEVETPDGVIEPDNTITRTLVAQLDAADTSEDREELVDDLGAHLAAMESALGVPGQTVPEDKQALEILLEDAPSQTRSPFAELMSELIDRLSRWLEGWFSGSGGSSSAALVFRVVFYVITAVLGALLLWLAVRLFRHWRSGISRRDSAQPSTPLDAVVEAARDLPGDVLGYADACAADGNLREAVRALFGGAARALQEAGFIVEAQTRTNRELLVDVRPRSPETYEPLRELALVFERSWYGHRDPSADEFAAARDRYQMVVTLSRAAAENGGEL